MSTEVFSAEEQGVATQDGRPEYEAPAFDTLSHGDYVALLGSVSGCGAGATVEGPGIDGCTFGT